jgi:subtilisin family serine protease
MAKRQKRSGRPARPARPAPEQPSEALQQEHRDTVTAQAARHDAERRRRPEEMRLDMMRSIITEPLLSQVQEKAIAGRLQDTFDVIIALNELFEGGLDAALAQVVRRAADWGVRYTAVSNYCFATLTVRQILALADEARTLARDRGRRGSVVYRIWEDTDVDVTLTKSVATVKADAAQRSFDAHGQDIVWAVLDSGIQGGHPHFARKDTRFGPVANLELDLPLTHVDFTPHGRSAPADPTSALADELGHGTHVAGIIAGSWRSGDPGGERVVGTEMRDERSNDPIRQRESLTAIAGVAPFCKLVSMKVIADRTLGGGDVKQTAGQGKVSWVLLALDQIQRWNQHGQRLLVHGVNMSLGYDFDPRWFGCGQSPICVEVNRLVRSGVVVVVSAGNSGYTAFVMSSGRSESRYNDLTITDPGNAELAITVGSTHRDMPHTYGVSYFSSRGPTGDGRPKPDLLAPGERIVSCAAGAEVQKFAATGTAADPPVLYCEQTGTSMAAPHVSGAVAVFLSARKEFIGQPERVKEIFMANCIDLRRDRNFQGAGLLDVMKVLQGV